MTDWQPIDSAPKDGTRHPDWEAIDRLLYRQVKNGSTEWKPSPPEPDHD